MRGIFAVGLAFASSVVATDYPTCSAVGKDTCPAGMSCDPILLRCYHEPRRLGEPCGKVLTVRDCEKYDGNTTHPLVCSTWCGTCVLKDVDTFRGAKQYEEVASGPTTTRCGITSDVTYANFEGSIESNMPIAYPTNDTDLAAVLKTIAAHGCKARPVGATHTSSSVITAVTDTNTAGISLAKYIPDDAAWRTVIDHNASTVSAPAGISLFDLYQAVRPYGFFLPTQTAGPIFTLAGVVSNSVHGGVYGKGYLSQYAVGLRVAVWTGSKVEVKVLDKDEDLRMWRNSYGLLGVITGVKFSLEQRDRFVMRTARHEFKAEDWTRENVEKYFASVRANNVYSENFFNPYNREIEHVLFDNGVVVPEQCRNIHDNDCHWDYAAVKCGNEACCEYHYKFGDMTLGQSCRTRYTPPSSVNNKKAEYAKIASKFSRIPFNGAPDLPASKDDEICLMEKLDNVDSGSLLEELLATVFYDQTYSHIKSEVTTNAGDVNDGFWLRAVPHQIKLMAYTVPVANLFDMFDAIRDIYAEVSQKSGIKQLGNAEFRFLDISNASTLIPTSAISHEAKTGPHVNCELVFNIFPGSHNSFWRDTLYTYEQRMRQLDGIPHTGKSFCYGLDSQGVIMPYQNKTCVKSIFNPHQKKTFNDYRATVDPTSLFWGGAANEFF